MGRKKDFTGRVYGRLTVISIYERVVNKRTKWLCLCECGNKTVVTNANLQNGSTKSCGCLQRERVIIALSKDFSKVNYPNTKYFNTGISRDEYRSIHCWIKRRYGVANHCSFCGVKNKETYDWALKKGCKYDRDVNNFIQLCRRCHIQYDFDENRGRNISDSKKGKRNPHRHVPVIQFDRGMNKISEFICISDAAKELNIGISSIANNLSGLSNSCAGFIFKYKDRQ